MKIKIEEPMEINQTELEHDVRHIKGIEETPDSFIIEYGKSDPGTEEVSEEIEASEDVERSEEKIDPQIIQKEERKYLDEKVIQRSATVERYEDEDEDDRRVRVAFASEEPVERSFGFEILSHDADAIDRSFIESGRAPVLVDHDASIDSQIGVVESITIDADRKSRAVLRFSKESERADRIYRQIQEGIIQNISVGYYPLSMEKTEEEIDGRSVHVVSKWSPREISAVAIPADVTVGVNRSEKNDLSHGKERVMTEVQEAPLKTEEEIRNEIVSNNSKILDQAVSAGRRDLGEEAIKRGISVDQFNGELVQAMINNPLPTSHQVDMSEREEKEFEQRYSLTKACSAQLMGDWSSAKYEKELSDEIAQKRGKSRGISVPDIFWKRYNENKAREMSTRVLTSGGSTSGTQFVPTDHLGSEFISALREKMILPELGTRMFEYNSKFTIPRVDAGASVAYVSEGSAGSGQTPTTGQLSFTPYPITAYVDVSREMMMMGDPSTDQWVADDLSSGVAELLQQTAINGDGSSKPTGILQTSGIGSVAMGTNGGAPTFAKVVDVMKEVDVDDAVLNYNTSYYLTNSKVKAKMMTTLRESSATNAMMIYDHPYDMLGSEKVRFTNSVPSNLTKGSSSGVCSALIYGDFSQLIINLFGGTDIIVDPYSQSSSAVTRIVIYQDNDIGVRHAKSFSAVQDLTT